MQGYKQGSKQNFETKYGFGSSHTALKKNQDKGPNVFEFFRFIQKKIFVHPFKSKRKVLNCMLDPKQDTNAKVVNSFLKLLIRELQLEPEQDIFKSEFMNEAMLVYTKRKTEIDTLARTFQNLNHTDTFSRSSRLSPRIKKSSKKPGQYNAMSKGYSKPKDIVSRFKISTLSFQSKGIIPSNISNVNKSISKPFKRHNMSTNNSMISTKTRKTRGKHSKPARSTTGSVNKSLQRYIASTEERITQSKYAHNDSRNANFTKSKSISQHQHPFKFETKPTSQAQSKRGIKKPSAGVGGSKDNSMSLSNPGGVLAEMSEYRASVLKRIPSQKQHIDLTKKTEYYSGKCHRKKSSASVSGADVYRTSDSRHFSHQHNPIYIANLLTGSQELTVNDSYLKEENKSVDRNLDQEAIMKARALRSPSENNDQNLGSLFTHTQPHGGERYNNEERLNFLTDANLSKIDNLSINRRAEKSVDLTMRSVGLLDHRSNEFITSRVISNNDLSKYLTKFIGNRDYRTTEERELEKCTFKPKFVNKHKYKKVKGKLAGYIKDEQIASRSRDIALFGASENIKTVMNSNSILRGHSMDGRLNQSLCMSDGGYLYRSRDDEVSTISVLNEMRSIPTIYSNKNVKSLTGVLQFGYSHKYQEKKHFKDIIQPAVRHIGLANSSAYGSGKALSLNLNDSDTSSLFKAKMLSPIKTKESIKTHRLLTNKLTNMVAEKNNNFGNEQGTTNLGNYTTEQLKEIRKIHEIHFKLKQEKQKQKQLN